MAGGLGGQTLVAGVYRSTSSLSLTGTLSLNGGGNADAVFILPAGSTFVGASGSRVVLENGAQACHVFWQVGSSATLGTTSQFSGSLLALTSITFDTGARLSGRMLAHNGAVTLDDHGSGPRCDASRCGRETFLAPAPDRPVAGHLDVRRPIGAPVGPSGAGTNERAHLRMVPPGPTPGQIGSSVILGHVDSYLGPGVFFNIKRLGVGALIEVVLDDGDTVRFRVLEVVQYAKSHFPDALVYATSGARLLNLVTCGGTFDHATGSYESNIVVFSRLVGVDAATRSFPKAPLSIGASSRSSCRFREDCGASRNPV